MLRIAFFSSSLDLYSGNQSILALARHFTTAKATGLIHATLSPDRQTIEAARRVMPVFGIRRAADLRSLKEATEKACRTADVLVAWGSAPLAQVARDLDIPVIVVSQSDGCWKENADAVGNVCQSADFHVAVSPSVADAFPAEMRKQVTIIEEGVEVDRVSPRRGRQHQRQAWGYSTEHKVIFFAGRYTEEGKQPQRLLSALERLPDHWRVVFAGAGPLEKTLRKMAETLVPGRCQFVEPIWHLGDYLAAADVVAVPSAHEGMATSLMEAWMAGVPTVAPATPTLIDLITRHGPLCQSVPVQPSACELAAGIQAAARSGLSHAAQRIAWNHHTASAMATRWQEYLAKVVALWKSPTLGDILLPPSHGPAKSSFFAID